MHGACKCPGLNSYSIAGSEGIHQVGTTSKHDETAIFTIALVPGGRRQVLALDAGRWTAPEILARIRSTQERYRSVVRVETNGAQDYVRQFLSTASVPVEAHATGRNKNDPAFGIESLAVELEQGLWIVPDSAATRAWARELIVYSPSAHTGDRLIASWLAREAARASVDCGQPLGIVGGESVFFDLRGRDEDDFYDTGLWVLGPTNTGRPRTVDEVAPTPVPSIGSPNDVVKRRRKTPFVLR